jgi:hypothetical protein
VKCATSTPAFFAEKLYEAMKVLFYLQALFRGEMSAERRAKNFLLEKNRITYISFKGHHCFIRFEEKHASALEHTCWI